jgi:hypothetical protein
MRSTEHDGKFPIGLAVTFMQYLRMLGNVKLRQVIPSGLQNWRTSRCTRAAVTRLLTIVKRFPPSFADGDCMTADLETLAAILKDHLAIYRRMPHHELAARIESPLHGLDVIDGTTPGGTLYTIETNTLWDDRTKRQIRVMADLSTGTRGCLLGFIPAFSPEVADEFILTPDGTFLGE